MSTIKKKIRDFINKYAPPDVFGIAPLQGENHDLSVDRGGTTGRKDLTDQDYKASKKTATEQGVIEEEKADGIFPAIITKEQQYQMIPAKPVEDLWPEEVEKPVRVNSTYTQNLHVPANKVIEQKMLSKEQPNNLQIEKAMRPFGSYIPIRVVVQHKDGTVGTAIRWKKPSEANLGHVTHTKPLPAVRSLKETSSFTRFSSIRQTMFLLADEGDIEEIKNSNFVNSIDYEFLGAGVYLYSDLDMAQEKAKDRKKEVLPVKVDVQKIFYTSINSVRSENLPALKQQGYEAIVIMRDKPFLFDAFCFDNRDIAVIGESEATEEIQKSIEEHEFQKEVFSKDELDELKCIPYGFQKSIIDTPLKEDGSVDYDRVPSKASIWVTVTKHGSPLEGRPLLITKRPDGLFAITGGAGFSHYGQGMKTRADAFRHLVLTGNPEKTKADKDLDEIYGEREKANEPLIEKKKELMRYGKEELKQVLNDFDTAIGIKEDDKKSLRQHRNELTQYAIEQGLDEEKANDYASTIIKHYSRTERQIAEKRRRDIGVKLFNKLRGMQEGATGEEFDELNKELEFVSSTLELPDPNQFQGLSREEIDNKVGDLFDEKLGEIINPNPLDKDIEKELKAEGIELKDDEKKDKQTLEIGANIKPLEIKDKKALEDSFGKYQKYFSTKKEINEVKSLIEPIDLTKVTPAMLEKMRVEVKAVLGDQITDAEIEEIQKSYDEQWQNSNSALSFYKAVGEFWNDETSIRKKIDRVDNGFGSYVNAGANSAIAAITGLNLGERTDIAPMLEKTSIETACMAMALDIRDRMSQNPQKYDEMVKKIEDYNSENQIKTEQRALERHNLLKQRYSTIQQAKAKGLLSAREQTGMVEGEVENLIEQKKNIGTALGSMQASAALLEALYVARTAKDNGIFLNFGKDKEGAEARLRELNLGSKAYLDTSDPDNIRIVTGSRSLRRYMKSIEVTKDIQDENEKIKTNMSGAYQDDEGNVLVKDYKVPMWKDTFTGKEGKDQKYYHRVEQRNDIEFLKKMGNGLITRVTGAGKTNTSLGFLANKINDDKTYSAMAIVPKGRVKQWIEEAQKFSSLDMVEIPEGTTKEERTKIIAGIKPNQIAVISHRDATVSYYDLESAFLSGQLKGMVLDEPQELASRSISGNMSAPTRKLMKLPSENRIALTATPARDNLIEAYDLVNWVSHRDKRLGPRARFQRVYGGYGSGTNAQDSALQQMIFREISPYMSGDKMTNPTFKINKQDVLVKKTNIQNTNMQEIESKANDFIQKERDAFLQDIENDPEKLKRWENKYHRVWKIQAALQSNKKARQKVLDQHNDNLSGILDNMTWQDNPKIQSAVNKIGANKDRKAVVFLDNVRQRRAISEGLLAMGFSKNQIKNIASSTTDGSMTGADMSKRVKEFRKDPNVRVIFIDKHSASGYNLQEGDDLHVVGTPSDAANYLQAQGRLARMPRQGDVGVYTYKYEDVPFEDTKWGRLENQLAILRAVSPGLTGGS